MDIIPHIPVKGYDTDDFAQTELQIFLAALKGELDKIDLSDYAKKEDVNALKIQISQLETDINNKITDINSNVDIINKSIDDINNSIREVNTEIDKLKTKLPNDTLYLITSTFTNPRYFWADKTKPANYNVGSSPYNVGFSFFGDVEQNINIADDKLEIVNITFNRNIEIDFNKTPNKFYISMFIDFFDSDKKYLSTQIIPLEAEWSTEVSSYDLSVYYKGGEITGVNENTKFRFSANVPYFVKE